MKEKKGPPGTLPPAVVATQPSSPATAYLGRGRLEGFVILWVLGCYVLVSLLHGGSSSSSSTGGCHGRHSSAEAPYGQFPVADDPFRFLPCTNATRPPALDAGDAANQWMRMYDPNPAHWSWGPKGGDGKTDSEDDDPYEGRGLFLCGYLDVPLDWTNFTDGRKARLTVTKYQVGGLERVEGQGLEKNRIQSGRHRRSERTIVIEPGGPGGSGTSYAWRAGIQISERLSEGQYDVLGWDPRGVNTTQPAVSCYPHDADRDRWQSTEPYRARLDGDSGSQNALAVADAMNEAVLAACAERLGDLGRFVSTGLVVRDLDAIREALNEPTLTGYLVSYGTGIGQTYAAMFPERVGRVILDGTEYVPDEWALGGFGWTSLDNVTDAWRDGFLGGCVAAGKECALVGEEDGNDKETKTTVSDLDKRIRKLAADIAKRPLTAYTPEAGPSLITYDGLVSTIYGSLYQPKTWPGTAQMLAELEQGNTTRLATMLDRRWAYAPQEDVCERTGILPSPPSTDELGSLVICADAYDAEPPKDGLAWYDALWANMTETSWISGNSRFYNVLPCRHFTRFWPNPAGVFRGPLTGLTLANPLLLIAETHDPATPLRNGRRLAADLGPQNARLVVHHGFGHASAAHPSNCTDAVARALILHGQVPPVDAIGNVETHCFANDEPYKIRSVGDAAVAEWTAKDDLKAWRDHLQDLQLWNPRLARQWM